ncbi:MAG: sn-glycerol-3-phosphate ABC transporter ATP-binding protein UgpC [Opitutaceae bacterium]|jgi:multiple sugar transport system ATP-binding protein
MAHVLLENLSKIFLDKDGKSVTAVNGLFLAVDKGEFMVLVGPSGCGKSTTLRMIAGLESVSTGSVSIDGRPVNGVPPKDRDIAMVFQNYALYPHMNVYENMAFGLRIRNLPTKEVDSRVREASLMLGLDDLLERKPRALSGGQRQRVAVGRAIVRKPKVFLFDEPLSNLDAKMRTSMRLEISRLHAKLGATMIYVTHDQTEAMTMGDRICVMRSGAIQQLSDPLSLYQKPANLFVAGFIGSPEMNQFKGGVVSMGDRRFFEIPCASQQALRIPMTGDRARAAGSNSDRPLVMGIRPEDVHDARHRPETSFVLPFDCSVELVEPMGAETLLHLNIAGTSCIARVRPGERYSAGQRLSVAFDMDRSHLFDAATEEALV